MQSDSRKGVNVFNLEVRKRIHELDREVGKGIHKLPLAAVVWKGVHYFDVEIGKGIYNPHLDVGKGIHDLNLAPKGDAIEVAAHHVFTLEGGVLVRSRRPVRR